MFNSDLPPRLNLWGEEMMTGTGAGWEMVSPIRIKNTKYAPVDEELVSLGQGIPMPTKKIDGVLLNAVQYNDIITFMNEADNSGNLPGNIGYRPGQTMLDNMMNLIDSDGYQSLETKEDKLRFLRNIASDKKSIAIKLLRQQDALLNEKILMAQ